MMASHSRSAPGPTTSQSGWRSNAFGTRIVPTQGSNIAASALRARCGATGSARGSHWSHPNARASRWLIVPSTPSSLSSMVSTLAQKKCQGGNTAMLTLGHRRLASLLLRQPPTHYLLLQRQARRAREEVQGEVGQGGEVGGQRWQGVSCACPQAQTTSLLVTNAYHVFLRLDMAQRVLQLSRLSLPATEAVTRL